MEEKEVRGEKRKNKKGLNCGRICDDLAGVWGRIVDYQTAETVCLRAD
jgi:hypothetical protein